MYAYIYSLKSVLVIERIKMVRSSSSFRSTFPVRDLDSWIHSPASLAKGSKKQFLQIYGGQAPCSTTRIHIFAKNVHPKQVSNESLRGVDAKNVGKTMATFGGTQLPVIGLSNLPRTHFLVLRLNGARSPSSKHTPRVERESTITSVQCPSINSNRILSDQ